MSTDMTIHTQGTDLGQQMDFARMVTAAGGQSILPDAYKGNPANVLIAVGLGQAMGLSPAESLYRIAVIKGKPSAGAELIAANVRRAGHKLRVRGDESSATATIIRADDPDYEFTVTRDMEWAKRMGLASNDNYRKQPGTMLQWRAISACARLACPEALYGVTYTPDEAAEIPDERPAPAAKPQGIDALREAVVVHSEPPPVPDEAETDTGEAITAKTRGALFALMSELIGDDADNQRLFLSDTLHREVASRSTLTEAEGIWAGKRLRAWQQGDQTAVWANPTAQQPADPEPADDFFKAEEVQG